MTFTSFGDAVWTFLVPIAFVASVWAIAVWAVYLPTEHAPLVRRLISTGRQTRASGSEEVREPQSNLSAGTKPFIHKT
jgi:predicted metal-binding membrane protein